MCGIFHFHFLALWPLLLWLSPEPNSSHYITLSLQFSLNFSFSVFSCTVSTVVVAEPWAQQLPEPQFPRFSHSRSTSFILLWFSFLWFSIFDLYTVWNIFINSVLLQRGCIKCAAFFIFSFFLHSEHSWMRPALALICWFCIWNLFGFCIWSYMPPFSTLFQTTTVVQSHSCFCILISFHIYSFVLLFFAFHDYSQEPNFSGFPESRLSKVERAASSPHSNWRGYSLHTWCQHPPHQKLSPPYQDVSLSFSLPPAAGPPALWLLFCPLLPWALVRICIT